MEANDLQIRMARKMKLGRGSMQITQADLDTIVQCGAYAAICAAATDELKHRIVLRPPHLQAGDEIIASQANALPNVDKEIARLNHILKK